MSFYLSPSILSADFGHLARDIQRLNEAAADWIHVDIMDGVFVPNISFGFPIMDMLQKTAQKPLDVHLMIANPDDYIEAFAAKGAAMLTIHYEGNMHLHRSLQNIKNAGMKAGVAINPHTPVEVLSPILADLDLVLLMSVNPGFGGQSFLPNVMPKIEKLKEMRAAANASFLIEVDGGVNTQNAPALLKAGADALVAGSAVFKGNEVEANINAFKSLG